MPDQTLAQMVRAKYPGAYDDLSDQELEAKVRAKYPGAYDDLPSTPAKAGKASITDEILGGVGQALGIPAPIATDAVKGLAKSVLGTIAGGGELIRKIPYVGKALSVADVPVNVNTQPSNTTQSAFKTAGDIGQFFAPGTDVSAGVKALKLASPLARGAARVAGDVALATGLTAAQRGTTEGAGDVAKTTAVLSAASPVLGKAVEAAGPFLKRVAGVDAEGIARFIAPKGSSKAIKEMGQKAGDVAPRLISEPGMGAVTREGLAAKIESRLQQAGDELDAVHDARPPGELMDNSLVTDLLERKRAEHVMASPAGPEAHAQLEKMGLAGVGSAPDLSAKFKDLASTYKAEMRRMLLEMENFQYIPSQQEHFGNLGGQLRGAAKQQELDVMTNKSFEGAKGTAGAPVFHDIAAGRGLSRGQVENALRRYIDEGVVPNPIIKRALDVANQRINGGSVGKLGRAMLPPDAGKVAEDLEGKIGSDVVNAPAQARVDVIDQAINEIRAHGPGTTYDALRLMRQKYDEQARTVYNKLVTDHSVKQAAYGAADVSGAIREVLGYMSPEAAAANKEWSFWKKADDVMQMTQEIERVRPKFGRKIISRMIGTSVGGEMGGTLGAVLGFMLGPVLDVATEAAPTYKITVARALDQLQRGVQSGNAAQAQSALLSIRALWQKAKSRAPALAGAMAGGSP